MGLGVRDMSAYRLSVTLGPVLVHFADANCTKAFNIGVVVKVLGTSPRMTVGVWV